MKINGTGVGEGFKNMEIRFGCRDWVGRNLQSLASSWFPGELSRLSVVPGGLWEMWTPDRPGVAVNCCPGCIDARVEANRAGLFTYLLADKTTAAKYSCAKYMRWKAWKKYFRSILHHAKRLK